MKAAVLSTRELSRRIEELSLRLTAEVARIEGKIAVAEMVASNANEIAVLKAEGQNAEKQRLLYGNMVEAAERHRQETRREIFRIITVGSALALVAGVVGYASIRGYFNHVIAQRIDPLVQFQFAYSRGTGLLATRHPQAAVPYLMQCLDGHEYDEAVLGTLINALDQSDDWDGEKFVVDRVLAHRDRMNKFSEASTWIDLAAAGMAVGLLAPSEPKYVDLAKHSLEQAKAKVLQWDTSNQRYIAINSWLLAILTNDVEQARGAIAELLRINDESLDTWEQVREYKILQVHFKSDPKGLEAARKMWQQLEEARHKAPSPRT
jgi:hypothetical protein